MTEATSRETACWESFWPNVTRSSIDSETANSAFAAAGLAGVDGWAASAERTATELSRCAAYLGVLVLGVCWFRAVTFLNIVRLVLGATHRNVEQSGRGVDRKTLRRHMAIFLPQVLLTLVFGGLIVLATDVAELDLDRGQRWALASLGFLLGWWVVYFSSRQFKLASLRTFLDDKSEVRRAAMEADRRDSQSHDDGTEDASKSPEHDAASVDDHSRSEHNDPVLAKAAFSVGAQGIFIAIIALFLTLILQDGRQDDYHELLRFVNVLIALVTILLMIFAIDILDTVANPFMPGERTPDEYRQWFYRRIGPGGPSGGISYAYFGFAAFSIFIIVAMAFFFPAMAGLGIATYAYLGYPLFFGFRRVSEKTDEDVRVEIDEDASIVARGYGVALLAATLLVAVT